LNAKQEKEIAMSQEINQNEHGQNLIIFAVLMVVMVALTGLAIDGGFGFLKRRQAQNAADAGALAGAAIICDGGTEAEASAQAIEYAGRNGAVDPTPVVSFTDEEVIVTDTIPQQTFLMKIFGTDVMSPTASASAGCYVPCDVTGVIPVAWLCASPPEEGTEDCGIHYGGPIGGEQIYVIMDSLKTVDDTCQYPPNSGLPAGALDCDLPPDDGIDELKSGGSRSWLDLDGSGGGSNQLKDWVWNGFGGKLTQHTWYAGQSGVANVVFQAVGDIVDRVVLQPVFDDIPCLGQPDINCPDQFHRTSKGDLWTDKMVLSSGASQIYYHVVTFSAFHVTCVEAPGVPGSPDCPGKNAARAANEQIPENAKTIEGYFVEYNAGEGRCVGPDTGVHTIYLNR